MYKFIYKNFLNKYILGIDKQNCERYTVIKVVKYHNSNNEI